MQTIDAEVLCTNTYEYSNDDTCDDGGDSEGSLARCYYGTDCSDCGNREWPNEILCDDTCRTEEVTTDPGSGDGESFETETATIGLLATTNGYGYGASANNGICEDGVPDNETGLGCHLGTDCTDCGPRGGSILMPVLNSSVIGAAGLFAVLIFAWMY